VATHGWKSFELLDQNAKIKLESGIIGSRANIFIAPHGLKIVPDPASIGAAMIDAIVASNASGMCRRTVQNSYQTIANIRIVLNDGTILNTADSKSVTDFRYNQTALNEEIESLRDTIKSNKTLYNLIKNKFKIKTLRDIASTLWLIMKILLKLSNT
jgi:D-lactate dehydrogenase